MSSLRARSLAHRLLFPALPPDAHLPPLVSSPELTAELYDLLALALRAFVVPWWSKISRYDKQFLPQITRILTTLIYHLDARIREAQFAPLLLAHVPTLVTQHYRDYRNAEHKLGTSYATGASASLPQLFHRLQPHIAISADGQLDPEYFRQLIDHVLHVCLPPEDYQPEAERLIVREVILKVLLNDVIPKISQPWFIQKTILDLLQPQDQSSQSPRSPVPPSDSFFAFHTVLVAFLSAVQTLSGAGLSLVHTYRYAVGTIRRVAQAPAPSPLSQNLMNPLLVMLSEMFTLQERVASAIIFATIHLLADFSGSFLDRLLPYLLANFLSPSFILSTTRTTKRTLFPNGYPGPPPVEPSPEEQAEIYSRLTGWKPNGVLAPHLLTLILGPDPTKTLAHVVDPLSSAPCNVHLILFLFDSFITTLFPELPVTET